MLVVMPAPQIMSGGRQPGAATLRQAAPVAARCRPAVHLRPHRRLVARAVKGVESFDGTFKLDEAQQSTLDDLLYSDLFCQQVARECQLPDGCEVEFTGVLFQPVPWSVATKKGMPTDVEERYYGREEYTIINVPPPFMFKAKVFQPPRLCAVYRRK